MFSVVQSGSFLRLAALNAAAVILSALSAQPAYSQTVNAINVKLVFTGQPANTALGSAVPITVMVADEAGNPVALALPIPRADSANAYSARAALPRPL